MAAEAAAHRAGSPHNASLFGLAPRRVCLAARCHHSRWWALTLSREAPPFHPSPVLDVRLAPDEAIGWSFLCCTCRRVAPPGR